jgi:hypothetical protein
MLLGPPPLPDPPIARFRAGRLETFFVAAVFFAVRLAVRFLVATFFAVTLKVRFRANGRLAAAFLLVAFFATFLVDFLAVFAAFFVARFFAATRLINAISMPPALVFGLLFLRAVERSRRHVRRSMYDILHPTYDVRHNYPCASSKVANLAPSIPVSRILLSLPA